jgi:prepilin-type N-terminal cleavage/methylation domain-containing protein
MYGNVKLRLSWQAFTLIELLVVIAILAVAAAIVVPMTASAGSMQLRAAANLVAADLEYAKSMAISRGQMYSVVFDKTTETYQIEDPNGVISHPVKKGFPYRVDFRNDSRLSQVDIDDVSFDAGNRIAFDYLGSPYNGNSPPGPLNSGVITLRGGGATKTVRVEPVTGYVTISN